jgi:hypothetical protein
MKIATITPMYNAEFFLRPFLKQNSIYDENIILMGNKPFKDYKKAGFVTEERDNTLGILKEFPNVKVYFHDFEYYSGPLFNMGMEIAESLGCGIVYKAEPDMFMTDDCVNLFKERIGNLNYDVLSLNMQKCTTVYYDFDHGVPQSLWNVGNEPFVIKAGTRFLNEGTNIKVNKPTTSIDWDGFMIHHLSGFKLPSKEGVELRQGFNGWTACPQEIKDLFYE